jgi:S1-C subfamily serine protease
MNDVVTQFSNALIERAAFARGLVAAIRISNDRHLTGTLWGPAVVVASEQSLPNGADFDIVASGASVKASLAGRDPGTNIALLRLSQPVSSAEIVPAEASAGQLALAYGADGAGGVSARTGIVNLAGPEWLSNAGGRIEQRIVLDIRISRSEEGGPVFDSDGRCLGISTFGPRSQVLVIPTATLNRVVPVLLKEGRVSRGWLGVALQPVAVPDAFQGEGGQAIGLMVMSLVEGGPAAKAGILAGDVVLSVNGAPVGRFRRVARQLGSENIGRKADLRLIRGGAVLSLEATIEARPAE